eukprot:523468_1
MWLFSVLLVFFSICTFGKRDYVGVGEKLDGYHAEEYCRNKFRSHLATITNDQENVDAYKACMDVSPSGECYIGLRRDSVFQEWYFTENNHPDYDLPGYTNWNSLCGIFSGLNNARWDEEYCDTTVNENAFVCNVDIGMPQQYCGVQFNAWYDADSFNQDSGTFTDKSDNGLDTSYTSYGGQPKTYEKKDGDDGLNGHSIVTAKVNDMMTWGPNIPAGAYTIFTVARYEDTNKNRVFESTHRNWIGGFHGTKSGVYHNPNKGWITEHTDRFQTNWVISSTLPGLYRGNGHDYTLDARKNEYNSNPANFEGTVGHIMSNVHRSEMSDYAFAEMIIIEGIAVDSNQMDCIEAYLSHKYDINVESSYDPATRSAAVAVPPVYEFDNFNPGQGEVIKNSQYYKIYIDSNYIMYIYVIIAFIVVLNIACIARYCYVNRTNSQIRYKTVSIDSSTDVDI